MLYAATFLFLAGAATGSAFKVRTLLTVLGLVAAGLCLSGLARGDIAVAWVIASLVAVQIGYMAGLCARAAIEHGKYAPDTRARRLR